MKPGAWLALVVLAGVIGFLLGRGGPGLREEDTGDDRTGRVVSGATPSRDGDRRRAGTKRSERDARRRGESAEAFVARMLASRGTNWENPFAAYGLGGMEWNRTVAAIFELPASAFPGVLDQARRPKGSADDPFADPFDSGWDLSVLNTMLSRWADLDPLSAMAWVRAEEQRPEGESMEIHKELVCRETLYRDPRLALRFLRDLVAEQNAPEILAAPGNFQEFDPFAPRGEDERSFETVSADEFFRILCREHPDMALAAYAEAGTALQFDGEEGWVEGMVAAGRAEEALEYASGLAGEGAEELQQAIAAELMAVDPMRVETWLEGRSGEDYEYLQREVMSAKFTKDPDGAAEWYLSRAENADDRSSRLAVLAEKQGSVAEATAWLERMERAGEDTGPAWTRVVSEASPEAAWPLMDRVPDAARSRIEESLFKKAAKEVYVRFGETSTELFEPQPEQLDLLREHAKEEDFEAFLQAHNAKVAGQALQFLLDRGLVEFEEE